MKRTAAIISFLMAIILLAVAISNWVNDQSASKERMDAEFRYLKRSEDAAALALQLELKHNNLLAEDARALERSNDAALQQMYKEHHDLQQAETFQAIGGVIFLIAGFAMWSRRKSA